MAGFILWISQMRQAFWKASPKSFIDRYTIGDDQAWDAFLRDHGIPLSDRT